MTSIELPTCYDGRQVNIGDTVELAGWDMWLGFPQKVTGLCLVSYSGVLYWEVMLDGSYKRHDVLDVRHWEGEE